ncbi:hypothetical protein PQR70_07940 [Paraburkholderia madseniana]|uniref:Uncharacterized protein n=1 Tax=Paraburkholderia madseniana TaxID=2599607 RepID=A0AAP5B803_9BURK|nr:MULTISPECIES: hypothetical protein [Paraburkholderia]MCX4144576.1 hypothetical protein [Paraburkholderia madseniana]MDN7147528.1 hypothetical protein [Paraburkholderia sp. WS6]MDQ6406408.1 hypothetical protein [Paraburkholderia madseniana]
MDISLFKMNFSVAAKAGRRPLGPFDAPLKFVWRWVNDTENVQADKSLLRFHIVSSVKQSGRPG